MNKNNQDTSVSIFPKARNKNLLVQNSNKELLIYDLETNKALCLNKTSALIWQNCDGKKTVSDIVRILEDETNSSVSKELVLFALDEFNKERLLDTNDNKSNKFSRYSRREAIKKIGFSSMIALPIITAIVAPNAVNAMSCVGMGTFPPGQVTASGNINNCPTSNICDSQGANCCTAMATITCNGMGTGVVPFTCNCT